MPYKNFTCMGMSLPPVGEQETWKDLYVGRF